VDVADRVEVELERRDHSGADAAAAQRPEQLGLVLGVRAHEAPLGGEQLDRAHAVAREAVAAPEAAQPAAERGADDADRVVRTGQARQPVRSGGRGQLAPRRPGVHARAAGLGVDLGAGQGARPQQQSIVERRQRGRAVAAGLHRDTQALRAGEHHRRLDVGQAADLDHRSGPQVGRRVVAAAGGIPAGVVRGDHVAVGKRGAQHAEAVGVGRPCREHAAQRGRERLPGQRGNPGPSPSQP
jgi:hypothetical protein